MKIVEILSFVYKVSLVLSGIYFYRFRDFGFSVFLNISQVYTISREGTDSSLTSPSSPEILYESMPPLLLNCLLPKNPK